MDPGALRNNTLGTRGQRWQSSTSRAITLELWVQKANLKNLWILGVKKIISWSDLTQRN